MDLIGFALAVLLIELTPGPNMAWLAGLAATEGARTGRAAVAGVALGLLGNAVLAALGLAALLEAAPGLWAGLRIGGAAMMAWLAFDAWRGTADGAGAGRRASAPGAAALAGARRAFATGALINLLNPKAYIFFLVIAPEFLHGARLDLRGALALAMVSVTIATLIHLAIVAAGGRAHAWLSDPQRTRIVRRLFAVVMLIVALSFLLGDLG